MIATPSTKPKGSQKSAVTPHVATAKGSKKDRKATEVNGGEEEGWSAKELFQLRQVTKRIEPTHPKFWFEVSDASME